MLAHGNPKQDTRGLHGLTVVRDYNIRLWLVIQDLSQIKSKYLQWQSFLAGMTQVFFGTNDIDTARYIADSIGDKTVRYKTPNDQVGGGRWMTTHLQVTPIISADSLMAMKRTRVIVRMAEERPMLLERLTYHKEGKFRGLYDY